MKRQDSTKDWFFALVITLVVLGLAVFKQAFEGLETKAYDWGVTATSKPPSDKVAIIAIDDN